MILLQDQPPQLLPGRLRVQTVWKSSLELLPLETFCKPFLSAALRIERQIRLGYLSIKMLRLPWTLAACLLLAVQKSNAASIHSSRQP